jgi:hypothetical protein
MTMIPKLPRWTGVTAGIACGMAILLGSVTVPSATLAAAAGTEPPLALSGLLQPLAQVERVSAPSPDRRALEFEDLEREAAGLPPRYALPHPVRITPATHGTWEAVDQATRVWRLRIGAPGARSLNLGFTRYHMPAGGQLFLYDAELAHTIYRFSAADNEEHGELWTPVVLADDMVIELSLPAKAISELELELTAINVGYRFFGELPDGKSGACNVDVVCPEGDDWRDDIPAVGVISTGGSTFCTGFMVNNTAQDGKPFFMTANHCGISLGNAASLVVYWNFESPVCGQHGGGSLADFQTGSFFRASYSTSDFTLVELDDDPNPDWGVTFAGWDHSSADPTSATAIHHPNTDEKSISFEYDPLTTTSYLGTTVPGNGSHLRITDWDVGTTEPGSSGSPLFDQNHRIVGQLHGGYAACGNDLSDWYGRFSVSWDGGGTPATRLSDWLDPIGSGALAVDTFNPNASGLRVTPGSGFAATGEAGGPFAPSSLDYLLENKGDASLTYQVTKTVPWLDLTNASGSIPAQGQVTVTVSLNSQAATLGNGVHEDTLIITNLTDGSGDTMRPVRLQVGVPQVVFSFPLDTDPGWTTEAAWAYGVPSGGGGQYGGPDPTSGHTGSYVYGYNLAGDYTNNMPEYHLTSAALDCSNLQAVTLKFWRWLGVEQPAYDHAYVRVSNDNVNWTTVWQNGATITDAAWGLQEYDISAVADDQATVYLRWTMGATDGSWLYCGWNIDDIEVWGLQRSSISATPDASVALARLLPNRPNPFNPLTEIRFELNAAAQARVSVYDLQGRLVRQLVDQMYPAGLHSVIWDGKDSYGRGVSSGSYLYRMEAGAVHEERKMLLVR